VPSSSDAALTSLNADLPHHVSTAHAHGFWGARLRQAGWDGVIIRGAAEDPVYVMIDGDRVEIRSADALWGLDTFETVQELQRSGRRGAEMSVACIGPAGEAMVWGACVRVDEYTGWNHGGAGVAWGAKNLKAIAVRAPVGASVGLADPAGMDGIVEEWRAAVDARTASTPAAPFGRKGWRGSSSVGIFATNGALGLKTLPLLGELGMFPGKNFTDVEIGMRYIKHVERDLPKWKIEPVASFNCDIACHHRTTCTTGPMAGTTSTGLGFETMEELGPNVGIDDPGVAFLLSTIVDGFGMAAASAPRIIAMMMEAYEAGEIGPEHTDGIELTWGNHLAIAELLEKTVERDGVGDLIAQGLRPTAEALGIEHRAVHMKWVGFQDYDLRASPMFLFQSQVASGAGPTGQTHAELGQGTAIDPQIGVTEPVDARDMSRVGELTARSQVVKLWEDCTGLCHFIVKGLEHEFDISARAIAAATGQALTEDGAQRVGERVVTIQRLIQLYMGFAPTADFDMAPRLFEKIKGGPADGLGMNREEFARCRADYYAEFGWSTDTGGPDEERLAALGLDGVAIGRPGAARSALDICGLQSAWIRRLGDQVTSEGSRIMHS